MISMKTEAALTDFMHDLAVLYDDMFELGRRLAGILLDEEIESQKPVEDDLYRGYTEFSSIEHKLMELRTYLAETKKRYFNERLDSVKEG